MAAAPAFAATPRCASVSIATANTNRDGTGTIGTLFTAGSSGSKVEEVRITGAGTTTAGMVRLFLYDGSTYYLLTEVPVAAVTPSASVPAFMSNIVYDNLVMPTGWSLRVSTHNAETFKVHAFGGDF